MNPHTQQFWVIDFRIFDPEKDGKDKVVHVQEMLNNVIFHKKLPFGTVLMDTWYATNKLMLLVNDHEKKFYCPIRKKRLVKSRGTDEKFQSVRKKSSSIEDDLATDSLYYKLLTNQILSRPIKNAESKYLLRDQEIG